MMDHQILLGVEATPNNIFTFSCDFIVQISVGDAIFAARFPGGWTLEDCFRGRTGVSGRIFGLNGAAKQRVVIT